MRSADYGGFGRGRQDRGRAPTLMDWGGGGGQSVMILAIGKSEERLEMKVIETAVAATVGIFLGIGLAKAEPVQIEVAKTASCGCCSAWVDHLQANGFEVIAHDVSHQQLNGIKARLDIDPVLTSCHTAMVDGYFIEGHVHADEIRSLLAEEPEARGLTVPGMPIGSPGMEMGDQRDAYETLLVLEDGATEIFKEHPLDARVR